MYLERIRLHNIRGFDVLDFPLERDGGGFAGWTVFTGDNGSGKSTLLKTIALTLTGTDTARALQPSFHRWIRDGKTEASVEIDVVQTAGDDNYVDGGRTPVSGRFGAKVSIIKGTKEPVLKIDRPTGKAGLKAYETPSRSIWSQDAKGWFSCGYGPFRRVFGASPEAMRVMVAPTTERFVTMFQEAASLAEVNQWLLGLNHKKLELKPSETRQLEDIISVLQDDLLPNQITVDDVDSDGLWLRDRNGVRLAWSEMSDGYRAALALVCDILRHLSNAYGPEGLLRRDDDGHLVVARSGVVLIDEIDAHLHPEWQREIGFWLKRRFPKIQFLVTSHSPLICQAADSNGLFVLPEPGSGAKPRQLSAQEYHIVVASRPDTILRTAAFGLSETRSPRAVEARASYARLKGKERAGGKLSSDEQLQLGQLSLFVDPNEPTLAEAL